QSEGIRGLDFSANIALGLPPNDTFAARAPLSGLRTTFTGRNYGASRERDEPPGTTNSVWWTWTAPTDGWTTLRGPRETMFTVYTGEARSALSAVAVETLALYSPPDQKLQWTGFECRAGVSYQIAASRASNSALSPSYEVELDVISLRFTAPTNGTQFFQGDAALLEMAAPDTRLDGGL